MNIFYLAEDPKVCAEMHIDKHVVKMILETAQLLCTAHRFLDGKTYVEANHNGRKLKRWKLSDSREGNFYKATHINHPCTIWCRDTLQNYNWLYKLFCALCDEYTFRYGKKHKTDTLLRDALKNPPVSIADSTFTNPAQAMPEQYKSEDAIQAYRQYYIHEKNKFANWTKRQAPDWWTTA